MLFSEHCYTMPRRPLRRVLIPTRANLVCNQLYLTCCIPPKAYTKERKESPSPYGDPCPAAEEKRGGGWREKEKKRGTRRKEEAYYDHGIRMCRPVKCPAVFGLVWCLTRLACTFGWHDHTVFTRMALLNHSYSGRCQKSENRVRIPVVRQQVSDGGVARPRPCLPNLAPKPPSPLQDISLACLSS